MYDARVGIISEGLTDQLLIKRIISSEFPDQSFVFTEISPTEDEIDSGKKSEGFGWGGVYKVCKRLKDKLEILHAAGMDFDILVIHMDGDVMTLTYESARIFRETGDGSLPCYDENTSITENCVRLKNVVESWIEKKEQNHIICIPHINSDVWAAYALYVEYRTYITQDLTKEALVRFLLERNKKEGRLIRMHKGNIKKESRSYRIAADAITADLLQEMKNEFSQLSLFCSDISEMLVKS